MELEIGAKYKVVSQRKGKFIGRLIEQNEDFATLFIIAGFAKAICKHNERAAGEYVEVNKKLTTFEKIWN